MSRFLWQLRMLIAEYGFDWWLWWSGERVSAETRKAFLDFLETLPREPL